MRLPLWIGLTCAAPLIVAGLTAGAPRKTPPPRHAARTTVLPCSEGPRLFGTGASGYWTPRDADLRRLEVDLPRPLTGYYRQYIGIIRSGKRLVLINGFSAAVAPEFIGGKGDWHHHAVSVMDGGSAFFEATYDPHTRRFVGPKFNGLG